MHNLKTEYLNMQEHYTKIYVACLASYNEGILYGKWIYAGEGEEKVKEEIREMLENSPSQNAEEFAIHDYENFYEYKIDEYANIQEVCEIAEIIEEFHQDLYFEDKSEVFSYLLNEYGKETALKMMHDDYLGCFSDLEDYFEQSLEEQGFFENVGENFRRYFDIEYYVRDNSSEVFTIRTGYDKIHVFSNY